MKYRKFEVNSNLRLGKALGASYYFQYNIGESGKRCKETQ